jgi:hypothetical protein
MTLMAQLGLGLIATATVYLIASILFDKPKINYSYKRLRERMAKEYHDGRKTL